MKAFNLAEARILERNYCQAQVNRQLRIMGCMVAFTLLVASASYIGKAMIAGRVEAMNSRLADAQGRCAHVKREMDAVSKSLSQRKWQRQLAAESGKWLGMLGTALRCVPEDVWLDSVKNSDKDATFAITGRAGSFDALTAFINALRSSSAFGDVRLQSAKTETKNGGDSVDFALSASIRAESSVLNRVQDGVESRESPPSTVNSQPSIRHPEPVEGPHGVPDVRGSG